MILRYISDYLINNQKAEYALKILTRGPQRKSFFEDWNSLFDFSQLKQPL